MKLTDMKHLIAGSESETLEFKQSTGQLARAETMPVRKIRSGMDNPPADWTLQEDLAHFKRLRLIESGGQGRGATYRLRRASHE